MGIERMILLLQEARRTPAARRSRTSSTPATRPRSSRARAAEALRDAGHAVVVNAGGGSFKSQMKNADASGARYALVVGDDEAAAGTIAVKPLRDGGAQVAVPPRVSRNSIPVRPAAAAAPRRAGA